MRKKSYPNIEWRNGVAQLVVTFRGKRFRESLHTSNYNEAIERRDKRLTEIRAGGASRESVDWHTPGEAPKPQHLVRDFADKDIEAQRARGSSEHVIKAGLVQQWNRICRTFESADQISDASVAKYYVDHRAAGLARNSIKRDIPLLRRCAKWGHTHGVCELLEWELPPITNKERHAKAEQAGKAIDVEDLKSWLMALLPPARAQALIALHTGARAHELRKLRASMLRTLRAYPGVSHVLVMNASVSVKSGERRVALTSELVQLLRRYGTKECLGANYKRQFEARGRSVLNDVVHLRDLRHTFASLASPTDPDATRIVMGHTTGDRNAAMFYQHDTDERLVSIALAVARHFETEVASLLG